MTHFWYTMVKMCSNNFILLMVSSCMVIWHNGITTRKHFYCYASCHNSTKVSDIIISASPHLAAIRNSIQQPKFYYFSGTSLSAFLSNGRIGHRKPGSQAKSLHSLCGRTRWGSGRISKILFFR